MITVQDVDAAKAKVWDANFKASSDCFPVGPEKVENPKACKESKVAVIKLKAELAQVQAAYAAEPKNVPMRQDGHRMDSIIGLFPLLFIGFVFVALIRKSRKSAAQAEDTYKSSRKELMDLQASGSMVVVTTESVPGREIETTLGIVTGMSGIEINSDAEAEAGEHQAMLNMMNTAAERGANAVVGCRTSSSSYEERGSKWMKAKISCTGTAVRLKP